MLSISIEFMILYFYHINLYKWTLLNVALCFRFLSNWEPDELIRVLQLIFFFTAHCVFRPIHMNVFLTCPFLLFWFPVSIPLYLNYHICVIINLDLIMQMNPPSFFFSIALATCSYLYFLINFRISQFPQLKLLRFWYWIMFTNILSANERFSSF